jgi:hypothetical protein
MQRIAKAHLMATHGLVVVHGKEIFRTFCRQLLAILQLSIGVVPLGLFDITVGSGLGLKIRPSAGDYAKRLEFV